MKPVRPVSSPEDALAQRIVWWSMLLIAMPLALFAWWTYLQFPSRLAQLERVGQVEVWHEALGQPVFAQDTLREIVRTPPDWTQARWQPATLPYVKELGAAVDLPPDAPKYRVWLRIPVPPHEDGRGRLGLLGVRVMGGPWAVWADGQLQQANLSDWRIQWNVPLRSAVPLGARELLLAVPYADPQGFAVGSLYLGPMDVVDTAWRERNLLHFDMPRMMAFVAVLMMILSFHLAWARPREPYFKLLGFNGLAWSISCLQYFFDATGQDRLAVWFGSLVDSSITWTVVMACIFAFEIEGIRVPRLRSGLVIYATLSTLFTLPLWDWQKNALIAMNYFNVLAFIVGLVTLGLNVWCRPRREGVALFMALSTLLALGVHTLENLTSQKNPDGFFSFPMGTLVLYLVFMYVMSRRAIGALDAAERHEHELRQRLHEQEQHLAEQHARLQQLEVQRHLTTQHESIMQDLHDRLGSNLTSALLQARTGALTPTDTLLLLQDLADELRHMSKSTAADRRGLNEVLAELRQRVQHRLGHGGIQLVWDVDPALPAVAGRETSQHLRALLSEAIANVIKHAQATQIRLEAREEDGAVVIAVTDNGRGFDPVSAEFGRGLPGMRQRAETLGALLEIESDAQKGCRWVLRLPLSEATKAEPTRTT